MSSPKQSDQDSRLDADPQPSQGICSCDTGDHLGGILYDLKGRYILAENQLHAIGQSRHKSLHGALSAVWEASQAWAHSSCTGDVKDRKSAHTKLTAELSDLNASLHILKDQDGLEDTKLCIDKVNTLQGVSSTVEALDEVYPESAACFW